MSSLPRFAELYASADAIAEPVPMVAAGGNDVTVLQALAEGARRGWVRPMVTGPAAEIARLAESQQISLAPFEVIDAAEPAVAAVEAIRAGRARALMKGQIATPSLLKAVLARETGLRTGRTIAQVVLLELVRDQRVLLLTDTGITITPTLEQKREFVSTLVEVALQLRSSNGARGEAAQQKEWKPRIALMAATEKATDAMPDSIEAANLAEIAAQTWPQAIVQGPLSFDLAYAPEAGDRKGLTGDVLGTADGMVFPSLQAANLTVKALMYCAESQFGGFLTGAACPVVFMSRADSVETRLNSLALTLRLLLPEG